MKLAILEYYGSYTAGTVVVIVEKIEDLHDLVKDKDYSIIIDDTECSRYKVCQNFSEHDLEKLCNGIPESEAIELLNNVLNKFAPLSLRDKWFNEIKSSFDGYESFGDEKLERIRLDWTIANFAYELKDGLYLVETLDLANEEKSRIVSWTYHSG